MKLFDSQSAPNPRRVRIVAAEKGITVDTVQVDINNKANLDPDFLAMNPLGKVPVLELDDGQFISESLAICRYFEVIQPEPALFGQSPEEKARIDMWIYRVEFDLVLPGVYRWLPYESPHTVRIDGQQIEPGATLVLDATVHRADFDTPGVSGALVLALREPPGPAPRAFYKVY